MLDAIINSNETNQMFLHKYKEIRSNKMKEKFIKSWQF